MKLHELIDKASIKFDNQFTYKIDKATKVTDQISVICKVHGEHKQEARVHLRSKHGCKICAIEATKKIMSKSNEEFIEQATRLHHGKYSYLKTLYTNDSSYVTITCPIHGDFKQVAGSHIGKNLCGCKACGVEASKEKQKMKNIGNKLPKLPDHISLDISKYENYSSRTIEGNCTFHGKFTTSFAGINKTKRFCPKCASTARGWNRSLYKNTPTILYFFKIANTDLFKLGITKQSSVAARYGTDATFIEEILFQVTIFNGEVAWDIEKLLLRKHAALKHTGPNIFSRTGTNEILTKDITSSIIKEIHERLL